MHTLNWYLKFIWLNFLSYVICYGYGISLTFEHLDIALGVVALVLICWQPRRRVGSHLLAAPSSRRFSFAGSPVVASGLICWQPRRRMIQLLHPMPVRNFYYSCPHPTKE